VSAAFAKGINSRAQTGPTGILGFSISRIAEKGAHLITHGCFVVQYFLSIFKIHVLCKVSITLPI
jgi:hypothetical protein